MRSLTEYLMSDRGQLQNPHLSLFPSCSITEQISKKVYKLSCWYQQEVPIIYTGLECLPKMHVHLEPQHVTIFRNKAFEDIIT